MARAGAAVASLGMHCPCGWQGRSGLESTQLGHSCVGGHASFPAANPKDPLPMNPEECLALRLGSSKD